LTKHKEIFDELEGNNFIVKKHSNVGKRLIISYSITSEGIEFYKKILEPYEKFFPRK
jgi:predicted transcriptional regulator